MVTCNWAFIALLFGAASVVFAQQSPTPATSSGNRLILKLSHRPAPNPETHPGPNQAR